MTGDGGSVHPPTMLDISSRHVTEPERVFSCPHVVVTLQPDAPPRDATRGDARWVLVKGWHDSGGVEGVYGPYTEAHADWLLGSLLDGSTHNWTKVKLSSGPEETP